MRKITIVLTLLFSVGMYCQEKSIYTEVFDLSINDSFEFEDYEIRFIDVTSDSRCPKAVMCIVAGEANVVLDIYKENVKVSSNNLRFTPTIYLPNNKGNIYNSEFIKVTGVELFPHPTSDNKIPKVNYRLKLLFEEIVE